MSDTQTGLSIYFMGTDPELSQCPMKKIVKGVVLKDLDTNLYAQNKENKKYSVFCA